MPVYLFNLFTSLALILSEILSFCTLLQANGLLHGILLVSQTLWLLCFGTAKTEPAHQEGVLVTPPTLNSILPITEDADYTPPGTPYQNPSGAEALPIKRNPPHIQDGRRKQSRRFQHTQADVSMRPCKYVFTNHPYTGHLRVGQPCSYCWQGFSTEECEHSR
jgi:hypothetical protein